MLPSLQNDLYAYVLMPVHFLLLCVARCLHLQNYLCRQLELPPVLANSLANRGAGAFRNGTGNITVTFVGFENVSHVGGMPK
jgi:hypothetical protein